MRAGEQARVNVIGLLVAGIEAVGKTTPVFSTFLFTV